MDEPRKVIELMPKDWESDREKPREPIFGDGWPGALAYLVGFGVVFAAIHWVLH